MNKAVFIISVIEFAVFSVVTFALMESITISLICGFAGAAAVPILERRFRQDYDPQ